MTKRLTIKNHHQEVKLFKSRLLILGIGVGILTLLLLFRLVQLQIIQHKTYTTLSRQNRLELVPIPPSRGIIYDRHGVVLATNKPIFSLNITPAKVNNLHQTIQALRSIIPIKDNEQQSFYKLVKQRRHFEAIPIKIRLTEEQVAKFSVNAYRFPGVNVSAQLLRSYSLGKTFAHVLGYVGRINAAELNTLDDSNYSATHFIGKVGIEKHYEKQLHGQVGYQEVEVNAAGHIVRTLQRVPPTAGTDLYLTIDKTLQSIAVKAFGTHRGALVGINPENGEVLAMVSVPSYDPNLFVNRISAKEFKQLNESPDQPLYNRAIRGLYPIGSTIKPFIALQGLSTHQITPAYEIFDPGYYKIKNSRHLYHDWNHSGHGLVNLAKAIIVSCDTYFYALGHKMGIRSIDDVLFAFGFGKLTHIDMDEELKGLIPTPEWKARTKNKPWYLGDTLNTVIGQGYMQATALQLANATAKLANQGTAFFPHLLYKSKKQDEKDVENFIPSPQSPLHFTPPYWQTIFNAMIQVVLNKHGTGFRLGRHHSYTLAAKTGTAQLYNLSRVHPQLEKQLPEKLRDHSLLIAFAPVKHPKIAVAVIVENSPVAPVVARKIIDAYMKMQQHS